MLLGSLADWYCFNVVALSEFIGGKKSFGVPNPNAALVRSTSFNRAKL